MTRRRTAEPRLPPAALLAPEPGTNPARLVGHGAHALKWLWPCRHLQAEENGPAHVSSELSRCDGNDLAWAIFSGCIQL